MLNKYILRLLVIISILSAAGCSDDESPVTPVFATVNIVVRSAADSAVIQGANVILYNAANNNSLRRGATDASGVASFENVDPGTFFVKISAQNFKEVPPPYITPVPFSAAAGQTAGGVYFMPSYPGTFGMVSGFVNPKVAGILVKAVDGSGNSYSTYTGPDGYYVLFNLPYESYTLSAFRIGYVASSTPQVTLSQSQGAVTQEISIQQVIGSTLSGSVTFLAVNNGIVDVTLLDRETASAVNGLATKINENRLYSLTGIPKGEYLAWASLQNDGYVMDPDWIFKNPGGLDVTFTADTGSTTLNFSVTGAIVLNSPTNPPDSVIPVVVDTTAPVFTWTAYPQSKEYIIEVRDLNGNLLWGGYNANGSIRHAKIAKETTSVRYDFDGSASAQLKPGEIYQWKIYADDDAAANIQTLLSSSEDLMGLFIVK